MGRSMVRMDMHLHTHASFDCLSRPRDILEKARARGLDRLIVTDHNEIRGALEMRELDPDRVIVGEEVKTGEGFDVIGIFLEERIPKGTPARETCERIREQGGVVYLPHPFDFTRAGGATLLDSMPHLIDVIEVHNARCWPTSLNDRALHWARAKGMLVGAGSDAHTVAELGRGHVELPIFDFDRAGLLDALSQAEITGRVNTSLVFRLASTWAKVRKKLARPATTGTR